jgi:hypothetical protein
VTPTLETDQTMQSDFTPGASHCRSARDRASGDLTSHRPAARRRTLSRADFCKVLRRAGYSPTQAQSILRGLPNPIDFARDGEQLFKRGVWLDRLVDAMG